MKNRQDIPLPLLPIIKAKINRHVYYRPTYYNAMGLIHSTYYLGSVHLKSVGGGGACKFCIGFGGGQVNSAFDLGGGGGSFKLPHTWKKACDATFLHFSVSVQYSTGTPFRYCVEGGGGEG